MVGSLKSPSGQGGKNPTLTVYLVTDEPPLVQRLYMAWSALRTFCHLILGWNIRKLPLCGYFINKWRYLYYGAMYFGVAWLECFASTISPNGSTPSTCTQLSCRIKGSDTSPVCQDYFSHPLLCLGPHLASSCFCRPLCPSLKCLKSWPCCQVTPSSCVIEEILK